MALDKAASRGDLGHRIERSGPALPLSTPSLPRFFSAAEPHRLAVLKALWPAIAGEAVSNHSEVVGIQGDVMRIRADSSSWLKTVRDLKGTLVLRLQRAAGPLAPRALAFVEGPVSPRPSRRKVRSVPATPALSDLPDAISAAAAKVPTEEGREIYLRAAAAFRARFGPPVRPEATRR
jgi:hypothetical protein